MVFQSYAVFPHMKVYDNIAFGLRMQKEKKAAIDERVRSAAELLHIEELLDRYSSQLSGGQRQRVAVARAIATKADVLLMDEPLSNLDALLRLEMRAELKTLLQSLDATTIYVTHDQIEALSMGDRIAVMNKGRIVQLGNPLEVYDNPADTFVGGFIGNPPMNFLEAEVSAERRRHRSRSSAAARSQLAGETGGARGPRAPARDPRRVDRRRDGAPPTGSCARTVIVLEPLGSHNLLTVRCGEDTLKVSVQPNLFPLAGERRLAPPRADADPLDGSRTPALAIHTGSEELATRDRRRDLVERRSHSD